MIARNALVANEELTEEQPALHVVLSDDDLQCTIPHVPGHLDSELFERFLVFSRHPLLIKELEALDETINKCDSANDLLFQRINDFLINKRKNRVNLLN